MHGDRKKTQPVKFILTAAVLCLVTGLICYVAGRWSPREQEQETVDPVVIQQQMAEIQELATVEYHYTNMGQFESSNQIYGFKIPFTTKKFILTYDGTIKAGVDLQKAEITTSDTGVSIQLPASEILSHDIDPDSVQIYDEQNSLFNPLEMEDFTSFQADQREIMENRALKSGLLEEAQTKAESGVRQMVASLLPEEYTLTVLAGA